MTTDILYKKVSKVIPEMEWQFHSPYVDEINKLKKEKTQLFLHTTI